MGKHDLISKRTRRYFREHLVGWTLAEISDLFADAGIPCDQNYQPELKGQRRTLVERYFKSVDFTNPIRVRGLLLVFEEILQKIDLSLKNVKVAHEKERLEVERTQLTEALKRDHFQYQDGSVIPVSGEIGSFALGVVSVDLPELRRQLSRLHASVERDPGLAIGTAKEILETVCRTILSDCGKPPESDSSISALVKKARQELRLLPEDIPNEAKGRDTIGRLLGSLGTVVQAMAELRNLYGSGHGKDGRSRGLSTRHAKLATGAATTLCAFLLETHQQRGMGFWERLLDDLAIHKLEKNTIEWLKRDKPMVPWWKFLAQAPGFQLTDGTDGSGETSQLLVYQSSQFCIEIFVPNPAGEAPHELTSQCGILTELFDDFRKLTSEARMELLNRFI